MVLLKRFVRRRLFRGDVDILLVRIAFLCCFLRDGQSELQAFSLTGKSTLQSTTHSGSYTSQMATDGNLATFAHTGPSDPHPWWKLDLGGEHCLGQITVVLRRDCCGFRFIGATARAGLTSDYAVNQRCGEPATSSQATAGATNIFLCDPPVVARWISFDIDRSLPGVNPNEAYLQLAEVSVKVYTRECDPTTTPVPPTTFKLRSAFFAALHKGYKMGNPGPLSSDSARRLTQCAGYCMKHSRCFSFDFSRVHGQCHLYSVNASDVQPVEDVEFVIYEMMP
ncbi:uncharacterized protein [Asterias amurensis]|uniref:uncharacterized protein n=1 Tax=Asterias amurensis TaxID=7602 RepID=UPI003AB139D7